MDQIADLLTRIKNTSMAGRYEINISHSKVKEAILTILKNEGFITTIEMKEVEGKKSIIAVISQSKTPSHLKQLSKPGRRVYVKNQEIPAPLRGLGTVIVSTSTGIVTGKIAKKSGLGGELICEVW